MHTDIEGYGKISISNKELTKNINSSESSIRRYNLELERKDLMTIVQNVSSDVESGCTTNTKIYRLRDLGQAIIWKIKEHEDQINKNTDDIAELKIRLKISKN